MTGVRVGIIMGSDSDLPVMQEAADILRELGVAYEMTIVSAHRTPDRLYEYARSARERGLQVIIAGAGGAAHLPGMAAAITELPVIGVPVKTSTLSGQDSLLSIVQMPPGVPVATVAINGAKNAGILAAQILGTGDAGVQGRVAQYKRDLESMGLDEDLLDAVHGSKLPSLSTAQAPKRWAARPSVASRRLRLRSTAPWRAAAAGWQSTRTRRARSTSSMRCCVSARSPSGCLR